MLGSYDARKQFVSCDAEVILDVAEYAASVPTRNGVCGGRTTWCSPLWLVVKRMWLPHLASYFIPELPQCLDKIVPRKISE